MPDRDVARHGAFVPMEALSKAARITQDHEFQTYWYRHVGQYVSGKTVLDAGAGMGYGQNILVEAGAVTVTSFDLVSLVPWVQVAQLDDYPPGRYGWVVAMDVIEHVEDDLAFLRSMMNIACEAVFFSTPNWNVFHATNVHHRREYTPAELRQLVGKVAHREAHFWSGDEHCAILDRGESIPDDDMACNFGVLLWK